MKKNKIAFTGFMGSGKTTMSRIVGDFYKIPLVAIDDEIEKKQGRSIVNIFSEFGEEYFRDLEHAELSRAVEADSVIVDLGGGAFVQERNRKILKDSGVTTIFLNPTFETICKRLECERDCRPNLKKENWIGEAKKLYESRLPFYNEANVVINIGCDSIDEVFEKIKKII